MADINELVRRKVQILSSYPFFTDFMNSDLQDNTKFLQELKLFSKDLIKKGFAKKELKMLRHLIHLSTVAKSIRYKKLETWFIAELTSEFITFDLIKNPLGKDLKNFYKSIYQEVFPEEEQEDFSSFMLYISKESLASSLVNFFLKNEYGDKINIRYYILTVKIKGVIVGAAIFYTLNTKKISFVI